MPPILYSFRRCPYAMRARMALVQANIQVVVREVSLKNKPEQLIALSPKATVPVLNIDTEQTLDESVEIMKWALGQNDPNHWLLGLTEIGNALIDANDTSFKSALDAYKYADRYPEKTPEDHRKSCLPFIQTLETKLSHHEYLVGNSQTMVDIAIFPFVRQFAGVDPQWFAHSEFTQLQKWLAKHIESFLFERIMRKHPIWSQSEKECVL